MGQKKIKTFAVLISLSGFTSIFSYLFNIFLARYIGLELHGEYTYVLFYATIAGQLVLWGTSELSVRLLAQRASAFRVIIFIRAFILGLISVAAIVCSIISDDYFFLLILMGVLTGIGFPGAFENIGKATLYTKIYLAQRLLFFLGSGIYISLSTEPDLFIIFMILLSADILSIALQFMLLRKDLFYIEGKPGSIIQIIREGSNIMLYNLSKYSFNGSMRYVIPIYGSMSMLSLFSLTWQYVIIASIIFSQTARVYRSELNKSKAENRNLGPIATQYAGLIAITTVIIVAAVWTVGDKVLIAALGLTDKDINISLFMGLVCVYIIVAALDSFINTMVVVHGFEDFAKKIYMCSASIIVLSIYLFENLFGSISQFIWFVVFIHGISLFILMLKMQSFSGYDEA